MNELVTYIRKSRNNRTPVGVVVAQCPDGENIYFGWSRCRKGDTFNRQLGLKIARNRLGRQGVSSVPQDITKGMFDMDQRAKRYFRQARASHLPI